MIAAVHIRMSMPSAVDESLLERDHRVLAAAHQTLLSRPGVVGCDLSTVQGPVVFVVALEDLNAVPWLLDKLTEPATVRLASPSHDGVEMQDFDLAFSVSA